MILNEWLVWLDIMKKLIIVDVISTIDIWYITIILPECHNLLDNSESVDDVTKVWGYDIIFDLYHGEANIMGNDHC